jgi:hypothetical protein
VQQGSVLGPLLFIVYINNLPNAMEHKAFPILFADETSILITNPNNIPFQSDLNVVYGQRSKWFKRNFLTSNFDNTYFIQFTVRSTYTSDIPNYV